MKKKIVYVDMDNVLVHFETAFDKIDPQLLETYAGHNDDIPHIFSLMEPMKGAIEAFTYLSKYFDTYILSTAPWDNPSAWSDKVEWVRKHLGEVAFKRLILTHHKNLNIGDFLIDDRPNNGAENFTGELIKFGGEAFPDWDAVLRYMGKHS